MSLDTATSRFKMVSFSLLQVFALIIAVCAGADGKLPTYHDAPSFFSFPQRPIGDSLRMFVMCDSSFIAEKD